MGSAFVKEGEYQQLKDVTPNRSALLLYLRRENGPGPGGKKLPERKAWPGTT